MPALQSARPNYQCLIDKKKQKDMLGDLLQLSLYIHKVRTDLSHITVGLWCQVNINRWDFFSRILSNIFTSLQK